MLRRLKLILFAAIAAALTVAGLSIANGGGGSNDTKSRDRGSGPPPFMQVDSNVATVLRDIHDAVEAKTPGIADPIIQKAQDAGDITSAQADALRSMVKAHAEDKGQGPVRPQPSLFQDSDVRKVLDDVFQAVSAQTPSIAEPIIAKAADDKKITQAQADQIRNQLKNGPRFGPGRGLHRFGHFGPAIDSDVANVLGGIHDAVEAKAPSIADPIIQKAQDAGTITSAQADKLRAAAKAIAQHQRPPDDVRSLLADSDVRQVVQDAFRAAAKQAPAIAEPILDKAVSDKKITSAQADQIRSKLKNAPAFAGGRGRFRDGPRFGPPGGPPEGGRGFPGPGGPPPRGNAPGAFPGGAAPGVAPAAVPGRPA